MRHHLDSEHLSRGANQAGEPSAYVRRRLSNSRRWRNTTNNRVAGASAERPVHWQVQCGIAEGLLPDELRHVAFLALKTPGLPKEVAALI